MIPSPGEKRLGLDYSVNGEDQISMADGCRGSRGKIPRKGRDGQVVGHSALPWYPSLALREIPVSQDPSFFRSRRLERVAPALHPSRANTVHGPISEPLALAPDPTQSYSFVLLRHAFWPPTLRKDPSRRTALYSSCR